jgi:hypothetical protein
MMRKLTNRLALLAGTILCADLLIPGVPSSELILQGVIVAVCGALMCFRQ